MTGASRTSGPVREDLPPVAGAFAAVERPSGPSVLIGVRRDRNPGRELSGGARRRSAGADLEVETTGVEPVSIAYVSSTSSQQPADIGQAFAAAYGQVSAFMGRHRLAPAGQPIAINTSWDEAGYAFDAGMPVASTPEAEIPEDSPVKIGSTYGGKALKVVHKGAYANLPATYEKIEAYLAAHGPISRQPSTIVPPSKVPQPRLRCLHSLRTPNHLDSSLVKGFARPRWSKKARRRTTPGRVSHHGISRPAAQGRRLGCITPVQSSKRLSLLLVD